jgi:hypothetical protein
MNRNYLRSRSRETTTKHELEKEGYFVVRAAGSKGFADLIAIRPSPNCQFPELYEVRFIQIKVSQNFIHDKPSLEIKIHDLEDFSVNVEFLKYPVKTKEWYADQHKRKQRELDKLKPKSRVRNKSAK